MPETDFKNLGDLKIYVAQLLTRTESCPQRPRKVALQAFPAFIFLQPKDAPDGFVSGGRER